MANKIKYDWKITAKKVIIISAEIVLAGTVVYFTDNALFLGIVPFLEGLKNYLKKR